MNTITGVELTNRHTPHYLGGLIKDAIKAMGISLRELGQRTAIPESALSRYLNGSRRPNAPRLARIYTAVRDGLRTNGTDEHFFSVARQLGYEIGPLLGEEMHAVAGTHDLVARELERGANWIGALRTWELAAWTAARIGDWQRWTRCMLNAAQMEINAGWYEEAARRCLDVLSPVNPLTGAHLPTETIGIVDRAEAHARIGWSYYSRDNYEDAIRHSMSALEWMAGAADVSAGQAAPIDLHRSLPDEYDCAAAVTQIAMHFQGRSYIDWGIRARHRATVLRGLEWLQVAHARDAHQEPNLSMAFGLLRQVPAQRFLAGEDDDSDLPDRVLARAAEILGPSGPGSGHVNLHRAYLHQATNDLRSAMDDLEQAHSGYIDPIFYPPGLARVFREQAILCLAKDPPSGDNVYRALELAVVAFTLHPYQRSRTVLRTAAAAFGEWHYRDNVAKRFQRHWDTLIDAYWRMERPPFSALRQFVLESPRDEYQQLSTMIDEAHEIVTGALVYRSSFSRQV